MLVFSEDFFRAEKREDFLIEETMKRYWACCMDLVNIIDKVCQKYGLTYYADWGTLLGAVRHNGFIPWDDDMDISMKRQDYMKLLEVLPKEMPEGYWLSNCFNNEAHKEFFAGFSDGREINISKEMLDKKHGCPFVATIDIFPLDYLPRNPEEEEVVRNLFFIIWEVIERVKKEESLESLEERLETIEELCNIKIDRKKKLRSQLWKLANQLVMSYTEEDGDYLIDWCSYINRNRTFKYEKIWYEKTISMPFENMFIPVPCGYEDVLTVMYGDWNKRVKMASAHDYPCFKKQMDFLRKKIDELKAEQEK